MIQSTSQLQGLVSETISSKFKVTVLEADARHTYRQICTKASRGPLQEGPTFPTGELKK